MKIKSIMILGTTLIVVAVLLIAAFGIFFIHDDVSDVSEENTSMAQETIEQEIGSGAKNTAIEILSALDGKMHDQIIMVEAWAAMPVVVNTAKNAMGYTLEELYEAWSASASREFDDGEAVGDGNPSNDINPEASNYLVTLSGTVEGFPEIFFTDARGYAIAANGATGDFDQGPDDWRVFQNPVDNTEYYKKHDPSANGEGWWAGANAAANGVFVGDIEYDYSAEVWGRDICVVIKDPVTGSNLGVLKGVYNIDSALEAVIEVEELDADSIKMITSDGYIAATSESDKSSVMNNGVTVTDMDAFVDAKNGNNGFILESDETGDEKLVGYASNLYGDHSGHNVEMICFVSYDPQTSLSPLEAINEMEEKNTDLLSTLNQNSYMILFGGAAIAVVVLVGLILVLNKSLTRPLIDMASVAKKVKKGDLDVTVDEHGNNEVSDLGKAFNQMILSVRLIAGDQPTPAV
jgi:HAMP domain-containing protein